MLCHVHLSEPMNRKVYWDLSCVRVKIHVLGAIEKDGVFACNKTCFGRICGCNIGDHARIGPKKLFIEEKPRELRRTISCGTFG